MAMTKCKECKADVSTSAKICPHCGVKNPGTSSKDVVVGLVIVMAIVWGAFQFFGDDEADSKKPTAAEVAAADAACRQDLTCWSDKNLIVASVNCDDAVEKLAKYSAKWTDGVLEPKFSRSRWLNKDVGYVTYVGDKIQFQNGFGAMQNYVYECDFDPKASAVLGVRARPGHL